VIKTNSENQTEIENQKAELNKFTIDIKRIHKFLSSERYFKFQGLRDLVGGLKQSIKLP
jgi:hypothetical protein